MILRDSCTIGPQSAIAFHTNPVQAYTLLIKQYSHAANIQRDALYREFYELNFNKFNGSLSDFNARFNNLLARLQLAGVKIQPTKQANHYLKALEKTYPQ